MDPLSTEQVREIAHAFSEAAAQAAVRKFALDYPHLAAPAPKPEIPAPLKWAAIIISAVMTLAFTGMFAWGVSTLNELQLTVARIDTRQQTDTTGKRLDAVELVNTQQTDRITALEQGRRK
jgi:hypothetical protein